MKAPQGYIKDNIGYIPLTQNMWALCDARNFHWLTQWNWHACHEIKNNRWYAKRSVCLPNGTKTTEWMHRVIMGNPEGMEIDHKNGDGLCNLEKNLRIATVAQNRQNVGLRKYNTSGFKGVSRHRVGKRWQAALRFNGKSIYLGLFDTAVEAAAVYNFAAKRLHGEFAVLNELADWSIQ
jgi:hypothetical protein